MRGLVKGSVFLLLVGLAFPGRSLEVTFERIGDQSTHVPGQPPWETFQTFGICAVDEGHVVSAGEWGFFGSGIYTWHDGTWKVVVDRGAPVPDVPGSFFKSIEPYPSVDRGTVAFNAFVSLGDEASARGAFSNVGGLLQTLVLDESTPVPDAPGEVFTYVRTPHVDDGVVFLSGGMFDGTEGVYRWDGAGLEIVADTTMPIPGGSGELFGGFRNTVTSEGVVAFWGAKGFHRGIYRARPGNPLEVVVDTTTEVPGHQGVTFEAVNQQSHSVDEAGGVVFKALRSTGGGGVYTDAFGEAIMTVADTDSTLPGETEPLTTVGNMSISYHRIAFEGVTASARTLYLWEPGADITRIIGEGDELDGQLVDLVFIGPEALSGDELVFLVRFETAAQALYLAHLGPPDPPEPGLLEVPTTSPTGLVLLALLLASLGAMATRARPKRGHAP